ncbi:3-oxoacyl-ACP synthase [Thermotalea metallivorans]|uniref:3-oxoacyl-[acyl-carrier-protein] synthase 3 n=1 Tax=Thermotalea metallivorans TaxID=520762 RepID=A0A140L794_9FIRM|nr:3-oxoacyl-ACP synthase [Thermotalea metallivorans]KXG76419.1 3-oxoacyl-[acyl-carrier-protein] synthase 3 [Thermotalea metallivorans]
MYREDVQCGIVGFGLYLPEKRIHAKELEKVWGIPEKVIREKIGIKQKVWGSQEDHCVAMTIKAAKNCLQKAQVKPEEIDLIIFNGEEYKEYICWTAAIKVQKEIGAVNAWAFDMSYRCAATPLALKVAKDMMKADRYINTVLIAGGNTICYLVDPTDPHSSFMLPLAPGACAILLKKNHPYNHILETSIMVESAFADDVVASHNGTSDPRKPESTKCQGFWKLKMPDFERFKKDLNEKSIPNFLAVARKSLAMSGFESHELDYVALVHIKRSSHQYILEQLGLSQEKSIYLDEYGHVGHVDPLLSLKLGIENHKIKNGSKVLLLSGGLGYSFAATTLQWGKGE